MNAKPVIRGGHEWIPCECPHEYRIIENQPGDIAPVEDVLAGREPSTHRLSTVLLPENMANKYAHDVKADQWYRRGRKVAKRSASEELE